MAFSALGLVISLLGLLLVWRFSGQVTASASAAVDVAVIALTSTKQNIDLASTGLEQAQVALGAAQGFVESADSGLENTGAMLGSVSDIMADDLPGVIEDTQRSLSAAEAGAAVIEEVLQGLNTISALTGQTYAPEASLTEGFAGISESLDTLPRTLTELDESLSAARENLDGIQTSVAQLPAPLEESETVLDEAQTSLKSYSGVLEELTQKVSNLQASLPNWTRAVVLALYVLLIWLAISQIGLLWQGWEMVSEDPGLLEDRVSELERRVEELVGRG
jgi:peptidoglycan hydrolase CwlO-like protein